MRCVLVFEVICVFPYVELGVVAGLVLLSGFLLCFFITLGFGRFFCDILS